MNKIVLLISFFILTSLPKALAQFEGTFGIGAHAGYGAEVNSLGAGIHIHYYRTNNLRLAPSFTTFLRTNDKSMWMIDGDVHYIIPVSFTASLYPIAGLHYSNWKFDIENEVKHRPGVNLGLGFQHDIRYRLRANFELKYQYMKDYSQIFFMAGFGFWF